MIVAGVPCHTTFGVASRVGPAWQWGDRHAGLEQTLLLENVLGSAAGSRTLAAGVGRRTWPMRSRRDWFSSP